MDSIDRASLLIDGSVVGNFWFNEKSAMQFITLVNFATLNQQKTINWPDKNRQWQGIPISQATSICQHIIAKLQAVYGAPDD